MQRIWARLSFGPQSKRHRYSIISTKFTDLAAACACRTPGTDPYQVRLARLVSTKDCHSIRGRGRRNVSVIGSASDLGDELLLRLNWQLRSTEKHRHRQVSLPFREGN